jgi:hypothetical protein
VNDAFIKEFVEQEVTTQQQVKETQAKIKVFKEELVKPE